MYQISEHLGWVMCSAAWMLLNLNKCFFSVLVLFDDGDDDCDDHDDDELNVAYSFWFLKAVCQAINVKK